MRLNGSEAGAVLKAENVGVREAEGPSWVGVRVDAPRHRVLVVLTNIMKRDFSALAAYDTRSWELLFRKQLAGAGTVPHWSILSVQSVGSRDSSCFRGPCRVPPSPAFMPVSWTGRTEGVVTLFAVHNHLLKCCLTLASVVEYNGICELCNLCNSMVLVGSEILPYLSVQFLSAPKL